MVNTLRKFERAEAEEGDPNISEEERQFILKDRNKIIRQVRVEAEECEQSEEQPLTSEKFPRI